MPGEDLSKPLQVEGRPSEAFLELLGQRQAEVQGLPESSEEERQLKKMMRGAVQTRDLADKVLRSLNAVKTTDAGAAEEFTKEKKKDLVQKARALSREARSNHAYLTIAKTDGWKMANQVMGASNTVDLTDDQSKQLEKLRKQQQEKLVPPMFSQGTMSLPMMQPQMMQPPMMQPPMMQPNMMGMAPGFPPFQQYPGYGFPPIPRPAGIKR